MTESQGRLVIFLA